MVVQVPTGYMALVWSRQQTSSACDLLRPSNVPALGPGAVLAVQILKTFAAGSPSPDPAGLERASLYYVNQQQTWVIRASMGLLCLHSDKV